MMYIYTLDRDVKKLIKKYDKTEGQKQKRKKSEKKIQKRLLTPLSKGVLGGYWVFVTTYNKQFPITFGTVFDLTKVKIN